ncbi:MAG: XapX domain-containing protein [Firmicutes bacterium]|nr:XapX domain-containing protein [Bacillota bacterium]
MRDVILALLTGFVLGLIFCRLKLPVPAPPSLAGVMGIVGIFLGYVAATRIFGWGD